VRRPIARNALRYAFVPGDSLCHEDGEKAAPACAAAVAAVVLPRWPADARCAALLQASAQAGLQWQLESDFAAFQRRALHSPY